MSYVEKNTSDVGKIISDLQKTVASKLSAKLHIGIEGVDYAAIFGNILVAHVPGVVGQSDEFTIFAYSVKLNMNCAFLKDFSMLVPMIMPPVKVNTMLSVYIHFSLNHVPFFANTEIHIRGVRIRWQSCMVGIAVFDIMNYFSANAIHGLGFETLVVFIEVL